VIWVGSSRKDLCEFPEPVRDHMATRCTSHNGVVYILHAFQKKSKTGRETPRRDIELVKRRLQEVEQIVKDLSVQNAEEHFIKAQLVFKIDTILKERSLRQAVRHSPA